MSEINEWNVVAANNNSAPPNGWPEQMNYSEVNNSAREGMSAHARHYADMNGTLNSTGSSSSYALASNRTLSGYASGLAFKFQANHGNTGAATLNVNGLGAKSIRRPDGSDLSSGDIGANQYCDVFYQGVYFVLTTITNNNQLANGAGYVTSSGWTSGNDGAGSGLDADLLDGLHADDILAIRQNLKNSSYTLALSDIGKSIYHSNSAAYTWTIPPNSSVAFPVGAAITMINDASANVNITIARGSGVTQILAGDGTNQNCTLARYGVATIIKVGTNKWYCSGNGVS